MPYPALSETISTHITYLDTVGRPKITLKYAQLTDKHGGNIYVSWRDLLSFVRSLMNCLPGYLQGPILRPSEETRGGSDGVCRHLRPCSRMEACRYPHQEEVTCMCLVAIENNVILAFGRNPDGRITATRRCVSIQNGTGASRALYTST